MADLTFHVDGEYVAPIDDLTAKLLIIASDAINAQRDEENARRELENEERAKQEPPLPPLDMLPHMSGGEYAWTVCRPQFASILEGYERQRQVDLAAEFAKTDEKTKMFVAAITKQTIAWAVNGDTGSLAKIVEAFGIPLEAESSKSDNLKL